MPHTHHQDICVPHTANRQTPTGDVTVVQPTERLCSFREIQFRRLRSSRRPSFMKLGILFFFFFLTSYVMGEAPLCNCLFLFSYKYLGERKRGYHGGGDDRSRGRHTRVMGNASSCLSRYKLSRQQRAVPIPRAPHLLQRRPAAGRGRQRREERRA